MSSCWRTCRISSNKACPPGGEVVQSCQGSFPGGRLAPRRFLGAVGDPGWTGCATRRRQRVDQLTRAERFPGAGVGAERRAVGRERRRTFTETKLGLETSVFMLVIAMIMALVVAVYVGDADLDAADGWRYAS
jgi:hypothetical protein